MIRLLALAAFTVTPLLAPSPRVSPLASPALVDRSCANPKLPLSIVTGRPDSARGRLPVIAVRAPRTLLRLAVVRTLPDAEIGLMCIRRLAPGAGMLFVFPADDERQFWMKNTFVPLDLLFVADDGRVRTIAARVSATTAATPLERIPRRTGRGRYVIELGAGAAHRAGIAAGTRLSLPRLASAAR